MKTTAIERCPKTGLYGYDGHYFALTEWEARADRLELAMMEHRTEMGPQNPHPWIWDWELRLYQVLDWVERRVWACMLLAGLIGLLVGWLVLLPF